MSVLPLPTPDRRVVRCANERCNRILRRPPINGLGPECAKAAGFEAPTTARLRVARQDGPDLFDQLNEGETMTTEYDVTVIERDADKPDLKETTSGGAKTTAAWLRAKADEIDPPRPVMRRPAAGVPIDNYTSDAAR